MKRALSLLLLFVLALPLRAATGFDGASGINYGDVATYDGLTKFTIALRVKFDATAADFSCIIGKDEDGDNEGWTVYYYQHSVTFYGNESTHSGFANWDVTALEDGAFHSVVFIYDSTQSGTAKWICYLDGSLATQANGSDDGTTSLGSDTDPVKIGEEGGTYWKGELAEVTLWANTALTSAQVAELHRRLGYPRIGALPVCTSYLPFVNSTVDFGKVLTSPSVTGTSITAHPRVFR